MKKEFKKLPIKELPKEKTIYIGVDDYDNGDIYASIDDKKSAFIMGKNRVFKVVIPMKKKS